MSDGFDLAPYRKPALADDGLLVGVGGPTLVLGLGAAFVGPSLARMDDEIVWAITAAVVAGVLGIAFVVGHPRYGPGRVRFADGVLHVDHGRGAPIAVPVARLKGAVLQRFGDASRDRLILHAEGRPFGVTIPLARLDGSLDAFLFELRGQVALHGDLAAFDRYSEGQVASYAWALAICGGIAVLFALWSLVS